MKHEHKFVVPARSRVTIACEVTARGPGPFACPIPMHLQDDGYLREEVLWIRGIGRASEVPDDEPR